MSFGPRAKPTNKGAYGLILPDSAIKKSLKTPQAVSVNKTPQSAPKSKAESPKPSKAQPAPAPKEPDASQKQEEFAPSEMSLDEEAMAPKVLHLVNQSARWLSLSTCLWCLIVMDAHRDVDRDGLSSFIQMLEWRINDSISEEEFAVLYSEWCAKPSPTATSKVSAVAPTPAASSPKIVSVFGLRNIFLGLDYSQESRLDLYIALISYETNRVLLNNPISYKAASAHSGQGSGAGASSRPNLETCTRQWLELAEELFFLLDSHGAGCLKFDDVYFLCACCTIGLNAWTLVEGMPAEEEVEQDIAPAALTALALQLMKDAGSRISLNIYDRASLTAAVAGEGGSEGATEEPPAGSMLSRKDSVGAGAAAAGAGRRRASGGGAFAWTGSAGVPSSTTNAAAALGNASTSKASTHAALLAQNLNQARAMLVTLPMFKGLLLKRGIGEALLRTLVTHVKVTVAHMYSIGVENEADDLVQAMQFSTSTGVVVGCPKLWARAVALATGDDAPAPTGALHEADPTDMDDFPDPLKLFLMADADRQLVGMFYGATAELANLTLRDVPESVQLHERLLYPMGQKLLCAYKIWSGFMGLTKESGTNVANTLSFPHHVDAKQLEVLQKEPVFMLILSALAEYKTLQNQFTAALFDLVMTSHANATQEEAALGSPKSAARLAASAPMQLQLQDGVLSRACAMLLHPAVDVQKELDALVTDIYVTHNRRHHEDYSFASALFSSTHQHQHQHSNQHGHHATGAAGNAPMSAQHSVGSPPINPSLKREMSHGSFGSFHGSESVGGHSPAIGVSARQPSVSFENLRIADTSNAQWKAVFDDASETPADSPAAVPMENRAPATNSSSRQAQAGSTKQGIAAPAAESEPAPTPAPAPEPATPSVLSSGGGGGSDAALETMLIDRLLNASDDADRERILSALRVLRTGNTGGNTLSNAASAPAPAPTPISAPGHSASRRGEPPQSSPDNIMRNHSERSGFSRTNKSPIDSSSRGRGSSPSGGKMTLKSIESSPESNTESPLTIGSEASTSATSIAELMAQGQSAGVYAQSLREILRKMSRNDSKVQIKSLEAVLQLGYDIAQQEEDSIAALKKKNANPSSSAGAGSAGSGSAGVGGAGVSPARERSAVAGAHSSSASSRAAQAHILNHARPPTATQVMTANPFAVTPPNRGEPPIPAISNSIKRTMIGKNIPGQTPAVSGGNSDGDLSSGKFARLPSSKTQGKVFGHNI